MWDFSECVIVIVISTKRTSCKNDCQQSVWFRSKRSSSMMFFNTQSDTHDDTAATAILFQLVVQPPPSMQIVVCAMLRSSCPLNELVNPATQRCQHGSRRDSFTAEALVNKILPFEQVEDDPRQCLHRFLNETCFRVDMELVVGKPTVRRSNGR